ncbi:MAG TPA: NDP-sugar synthase [Nakamurella sp.]|jgi:mannose-1-phosphate guanylyltransferase
MTVIAPAEVDAVVLVGGKGTRLRPLTLSAAKPMLPTAGVPYLEHLLSRIREAGMRHVVLGTSYRAETFEEYFGDGSDFGLDIEYVVEDEPLGTGGGIRNVFDRLRYDTAMIFNGDVLSGVDLRAVLRTHEDARADVTLHLVRVADPRAFGCVPTDATGRVLGFLEKTDNPPTDQINAGCYVFRRDVVAGIPAGVAVSVERDTFPSLLAGGARVVGHVDTSYWLDLGTPMAFVQGSADLVAGVAPTAALPKAQAHDIDRLILSGARVDPAAVINGGSAIGAGARVAAGAEIRGCVVMDEAQIGPDAQLASSVIGRSARIGAGVVLVDAVIGDGAVIGAGCELRAGARVWPGVVLADGAIRFSSDG